MPNPSEAQTKTDKAKPEKASQPKKLKYRRNVGVIITNKKRTKVLVFHRLGADENGWQFPQGGVDHGETDNEAFYRELKEEIGTNAVKVLDVTPKRIKYRFPPWVMEKFAQERGLNRYKGQTQRWYLAQLKRGVASISFEGEHPEFDDYRWVSPKKALKSIVPFKKRAYKKALRWFGLLPPKKKPIQS